ncbi:MAG TPA: hypothetical protein DEA08_15885, partial [Planctomycetes bacterium]|nr:hypothetical protein [Planctomycetota bacterium]
MSFSFYVTAYAPPAARLLIEQVDDHGDLRVAEEIQDGPWEEGFAYHLHREGVSTRGVELCWENDQLQVRLLTLASPEDWELAFRVLEEAAAEDEVRGENGESAPASQVRETFASLCELSNEGGTAFLVDRIQSEEAVLTLPGPVRAFCIGPRLLGELEGAGERDELTQRILGKIREVQYTREARDYYCASVLQASVDDELAFTLTAFGPGVRYLLPEVQFVALVTEEDEELFLDHDSFLGLLSGWARYLDERQVFVEPLSGPNWERFLAAARACAVEPLAFVKGEVERDELAARAREHGAKLSETLDPHEPSPEDPAELDRAIELLRDARERRPDDLGILDDLANAYAQRAQARLARGEHEEALRDQDQ